MSHLIELIRSRESSWARPNNGNSHSRALLRNSGGNETIPPSPVYDSVFNIFDCDRAVYKSSYTTALHDMFDYDDFIKKRQSFVQP
mmetsp:Transcript_18221/g.41526  ORF Transcript_18221/g.41526 Transcript_18221/m.41526 type:complete len:86 (+) Transcript_18221:1328-1585(+)